MLGMGLRAADFATDRAPPAGEVEVQRVRVMVTSAFTPIPGFPLERGKVFDSQLGDARRRSP